MAASDAYGPLVRAKLYKTNKEPSDIELRCCKALIDLEASSKDLKADLHDLQISSAMEMEYGHQKKGLVIFVPYVQRTKFQKIQVRLIRELEKKFSGRNVAFVPQRTILSTNYKRQKGGQNRPRSRTLTSVHRSILEDLVYPTPIVGMRTQVRFDGSHLQKIYLDPKQATSMDQKLFFYKSVYQKLTNKNTTFLFE
eukprot:138833_1